MPNYKRALLVATEAGACLSMWITYDKQYKIVHFQSISADGDVDRDTWDLYKHRTLDIGADWVILDENTTQAAIEKFLNIILYPAGSTPSSEYSGLGTAPLHLWGSDHVEVCKTGPPDRE